MRCFGTSPSLQPTLSGIPASCEILCLVWIPTFSALRKVIGHVRKQLGICYTDQCLDVEKRVSSFVEHLEFYSRLSAQPINMSKTVALFSARAVGLPKFDIFFNRELNERISWIKEYKYLGYWICQKGGWSRMIRETTIKVRQRISRIKSFKLSGVSSPALKRALFDSYVLPIFTWIYPIYPLFSERQRAALAHFYLTSLRRTLDCLQWNEFLFVSILNEKSLDDRVVKYWNKYLVSLADSVDGSLLFEKANVNAFRKSWLEGDFAINCLRRSKRLVEHTSVLEKVICWMASVPSVTTNPEYEMDELILLQEFPESF